MSSVIAVCRDFLAFFSLAGVAVAVLGCGAAAGTECGEGTVQSGESCVATAPTCGEGTVAVDGKCVPAASDVSGSEDSGEPEDTSADVTGGDTEAADTVGDDTVEGDADAGDAGDLETVDSGDASATWSCEPATEGDGVFCDCGCGAPDPDCATGLLTVRGCTAFGATCDASGACKGGVDPLSWTCPLDTWKDGNVCHCGCGQPDPDCADGTLAVLGCGGKACGTDGTCAPCAPDCDGKTCGSNGCGGLCGVCFDAAAPYCDKGTCQATCIPKCAGKACGDDGCGGDCGACTAGEHCVLGACDALPAAVSCDGHCGGKAVSGCSCEGGCASLGTCCPDVHAVCGCQPDCIGRNCGDDGCGGSCGTCSEGDVCVLGGCQADPCDPAPCNGHGVCQYPDGACTCDALYAGDSCNQCIPGYKGFPDCVYDWCAGDPCSGHGTCSPADGSCACKPGFAPPHCDACLEGHGNFPGCVP
ncbi:MAG: hypothetical protein IV100_07520 [Myxococcales bacterium]|nr:hypothetical protein [Myxococcales bacterium]